MKKKLFAALVVVALALSAVIGLVSCGPKIKANVDEAVVDAGKMTYEQLEAAAKLEFETALEKDPNLVFTAAGSTSGLGKAIIEFAKTHEWFKHEEEIAAPKDSEMFKSIDEKVTKGQHYKDLLVLQGGATILDYIDEEYLYNVYIKNDDKIQVDQKDQEPLSFGYADKLFIYNKALYTGDVQLKNVWQLTGVDGTTLKQMPLGLSLQDPTNEAINMSMLAMMTSPSGIEALTKAYKTYFGTDYTAQSGYKNIGYYFIGQLLDNGKKHDKDSNAMTNIVPIKTDGQVFALGLNKTKKYAEGKNWKTDLFVPGLNGNDHVEGFDGFLYKFYLTIPKTSKLPYTASLIARYCFTQEGYTAGWKDAGYYSTNSKITLEVPASNNALIEDPVFIGQNYDDIEGFVKLHWNK